MRVQNRKEQFGVLVEEVRAEEEIALKKSRIFSPNTMDQHFHV